MEKTVDGKLETFRHTLAHILAAAVQKIRPAAKLGIGPATDEGFFYDFLTDKPFSVAELGQIEQIMRKLARKRLPLERSVLTTDEARQFFGQRNEILKVELIDDLEAKGNKEVSLYKLGDFVDLCQGPHIENTEKIGKTAFRLDRVAGAYWKNNELNPMLSRIYGLAFHDNAELEAFIEKREEAAKRDHRKIGRELDLFVISPMVGKGLPMLTEKGATIRRVLERFIVDEEIRRGYLHVNTPILGRKHMYEVSGHWAHYQDSMYPPINVDGEDFVLRPMTCPHHFMLYASKPRSYRDLPLRLAEIGAMYRKERSGELTGLIRVMGFHLADAHIFIEPEEVHTVFREVVDLIIYVMKSLGLTDRCWYRVSLKNGEKEKYIDMPKAWSEAEKALVETCSEMNLNYMVAKGHAAFYGPKLDVQTTSVGGREETLFTNQIDLALSQRFNLEYVARDGQSKQPWVIHRSSIGCLERTIAFLIEHYAGAFPTWLAPVQLILLPIGEKHIGLAETIKQSFAETGIRVVLDDRGETLGRKLREARLQKIPYIGVIGDKESQEHTLTVTNRDTKLQENISIDIFLDKLALENARRSLCLTSAGTKP